MPARTPAKKILVIEDEMDLAHLLKYNLQDRGYGVLSANDAESGLALARKQKPDLIVLDLMLPQMDGFEFCRIIREESSVPVIFLTASKNEVCRKMALKLGADDYITKPFSVDAVLDRIESLLSRSSPA